MLTEKKSIKKVFIKLFFHQIVPTLKFILNLNEKQGKNGTELGKSWLKLNVCVNLELTIIYYSSLLRHGLPAGMGLTRE